jgi:hypothetical protein
MNDLLAGTSLIIGIAAANAAPDKIGFKEFLESTPPIEELVYEVVPSETNQPAQSYFVRWQNGAYVVRRSPKLSWVTEPLTSASVTEDWISGKYGSNWWKITPGPTAEVKFWSWIDTGGPAARTNNLVWPAVQSSILGPTHLLHFGINLIPLGEVRWDGNHLTYTNTDVTASVDARVSFQGERPEFVLQSLHKLTRNLPKDVPRVTHFRIEYEYGTGGVPTNLPSGFRKFWLKDEGKPPREGAHYVIHKLKLAEKPLGAASFGPQQFFGQLPVTRFVVLPSGAYCQNESNRWERMLPPDSPLIYDPELEKLKKNPPKSLF